MSSPGPQPSTPASPNSPAAAPNAASWQFAENFHPDSEPAERARSAAENLGTPVAGRGATGLLTVLAKAVAAHAVVEIGTGAGVTGLALFEGMAAGGVLTSVDTEHEQQTAARRAFSSVGIPARRFRLITGNALDVLPKLSDEAYDMVLVNGDKLEYAEYVAQAMRLLRPGGLLVVNHALWGNRVADSGNSEDETIVIREALGFIQEHEQLRSSLVPAGDGVLVAVKDA